MSTDGNLTSKYTKHVTDYIETLKSRKVDNVVYLKVIPTKPITVDEYERRIIQEFDDLKTYLSNKYLEFKIKLSKGTNTTIDDYIKSVIFFTDATFTKLDLDLISKNINLKSDIIERQLKLFKELRVIGDQNLRVNTLSNFNERTDKRTFNSEIRAVHSSFPSSMPGFGIHSDKYSVFYDFFIHVLKILDEKFRKTYDTTTGKPIFNIIFRKKYDTQNKDVLNDDSLFKVSIGRSQIYEIELPEVSYTMSGYLDSNKNQSNRYIFKHNNTNNMLYEHLYKYLYSSDGYLFLSQLILATEQSINAINMLKEIYGIVISPSDYTRIINNQNNQRKKNEKNETYLRNKSKYGDYMTTNHKLKIFY